jgi:hypothetical protein
MATKNKTKPKKTEARSLFEADEPSESPSGFPAPPDALQTLQEKIKQRRAQMLVHSCIYYELDDNIVSDHTWQRWAEELQKLQEDHPEYLKIGFYDHYFKDWDSATGAHLPHRDPWVYRKATQLLKLRDGKL